MTFLLLVLGLMLGRGRGEASTNPMLYLGGGAQCNPGCLGPPPDSILRIPPPPPAPHNTSCLDLCQLQSRTPLLYPAPAIKFSDAWQSLSLLVLVTLTAILLMVLLIVARLKKWRIFPMHESCPLLPDTLLGGGPKGGPASNPAPPNGPPTEEAIYHDCQDPSPEYTELDYAPWWSQHLKAYDNEGFLASEFAKNFATVHSVVRLQTAPPGYQVSRRPLPPLPPGKYI